MAIAHKSSAAHRGQWLPQIDVFLESGYTKEEQKMIDETRKILSLPNLAVTAKRCACPYTRHSEASTWN